MICPNCGSQLPDGAAFCGECGTRIAPSQPAAFEQAQPTEHQTIGQQPYQQPAQQPGQYQQFSQGAPNRQQNQEQQPATSRAFAMTLYVASLLGVIFALCVRDKNDAFITHHLNNAVVILIGAFIGSLLSIVLIGFVVLLYLFVMVIMGIVSAYNGNTDELPLIGKIHIVR